MPRQQTVAGTKHFLWNLTFTARDVFLLLAGSGPNIYYNVDVLCFKWQSSYIKHTIPYFHALFLRL